MTLGEKKGEMFSVKATEDSQSRAVTIRAQLLIQSDLQLPMNTTREYWIPSITRHLFIFNMIYALLKPNTSKHLLHSTACLHHRALYKYLHNLILRHSDMLIKVPNENEK